LLAHAPVVQNQALRRTSAWANNWLGRDQAAKRAVKSTVPNAQENGANLSTSFDNFDLLRTKNE
jgi:hypothetical protein